ncbi:hypothetical protein [Massilia sp. TS11]|uniref:hypothetical protein n=1 Tax=Massilia sp. TS11 TaxID=2908003 RepID=UPI001EDBC810|nr:hypothetical protein [Massilia sp. TS11]MCG2586037.1 hypothetical protein [Massilia sp. TS11]
MKTLLPLLLVLLAGCSQEVDLAVTKPPVAAARSAGVRTATSAPAGGLGGVLELFARTGPEQVVGAASSAPAGLAGPLPYARPDLSPDPAERARAAELQAALNAHDLQRAQALATSVALQQLYNEGQRAYAEHLRTESITANADKEKITGREP